MSDSPTQTPASPLFGLDTLQPDCTTMNHQTMTDMIALLGLLNNLGLILSIPEHNSIIRMIQRLCDELAISFETLGLQLRE